MVWSCLLSRAVNLASATVVSAFALASCWYYAQLAFRLVKPDALEALTFLFLPVYQCAALGVCLGLAAAWHRCCGRP